MNRPTLPIKKRKQKKKRQITYKIPDPKDIYGVYSEEKNTEIVFQYFPNEEKEEEQSALEKIIEEIINPPKENTSKNKKLEEILKSQNYQTEQETYQDKTFNIDNYRKIQNKSPISSQNTMASHGGIDPESGARVYYIPLSSLPHGLGYQVLGYYDPATHSFYVASDHPEKEWIYQHEKAHALGERTEPGADAYATRATGRNPFPGRLAA